MRSRKRHVQVHARLDINEFTHFGPNMVDCSEGPVANGDDEDRALTLEMADGGESGYGGISNNGKGPHGNGDSGNGHSEDEENDKKRSLPVDLQKALDAGALSAEALARYRKITTSGNIIMQMMMRIPSFRTRVMADSAFVFKLLVQELVGNGTALASEFAVRGKDIANEIEYVASDLIIGTVVEAAFVWLLAPRLATNGANASLRDGKLSRFLASLPANAFEASTAIKTYTFPLRAASFINAALQYAAIGLGAGIVGTMITYGLIESRKLLDSNYVPERPLPPVFANSAGWAAFMALSSNTRFQLVEGIERMLPTLIKGGRAADAFLKVAIVGLRFGNNYWGGVQFIKFFRFLGLHAVAEHAS